MMTFLKRLRRAWLPVLVIGLAVVLVAPSLILIPMSFSASASLQFPPQGFTLHWYGVFFTDPKWYTTAILSVKVAVLTVLLSTSLGVITAFGLVRGSRRVRGAVSGIFVMPLLFPSIVGGLGIYLVFSSWNLSGNIVGLVLAQTTFALPFAVIVCSAALSGLDENLERAARILGASPVRAVLRITLPQLRPSLVTAALFAFITSWDEVVIAYFMSSPQFMTLPVRIYQQSSESLDPTPAATGTMLTLLSLMVVVIATIRDTHAQRKGRKSLEV